MSDLSTLIADLERATGPDILLDARCWDVLDARPRVDDGGGAPIFKRDPEDSIALDAPPPFTASVDAALKLVPERWTSGGIHWLGYDNGKLMAPAVVELWHALSSGGAPRVVAYAATISLGICIASLMARAALKTTNDR